MFSWYDNEHNASWIVIYPIITKTCCWFIDLHLTSPELTWRPEFSRHLKLPCWCWNVQLLNSDTDLEVIRPIVNIFWSSGSNSVKKLSLRHHDKFITWPDLFLLIYERWRVSICRYYNYIKSTKFFHKKMWLKHSLIVRYGLNYRSEDLPSMDNDPSWWFMAELYLAISFLLRVNQPNQHQSIVDLLFVSVFRGSQPGRTLPGISNHFSSVWTGQCQFFWLRIKIIYNNL